jgi:cardiolipin synthase
MYLHYLIPIFLSLLFMCGLACAAHAVCTARTAQGSIAWAVSLITFPLIAVPLYLVFGRNKFEGYVEAMRVAQAEGHGQLEELIRKCRSFAAELPPGRKHDVAVLQRPALLPCLGGNSVRLLIDGQATFDAIFEAIRRAKSYILVQFFIIHDDQVGRELKELLLAKRREGVRVYVQYDFIGSLGLPRSWVAALRDTGGLVTPFRASRGSRFQINFRNHRKIVVVDGREAFIGGHNVGDEYLGRHPKIGRWRDTHCAVRGPVVQAIQLSFIMDWYWTTPELPELEWTPEAADGDSAALFIPTGPADSDNHCEMMIMQAAHMARERLWLTSPYFVPNPAVFEALRLAAIRGVDVRLIIPAKSDHLIMYLATFPCVTHARQAGIKIYRYSDGFLHQKVILVDDDLSAIGTVNLDNRSLRLNFELTMWVHDRPFAAQVAAMLGADMAQSRLVERDELAEKSLVFFAACRFARLMEPVL